LYDPLRGEADFALLGAFVVERVLGVGGIAGRFVTGQGIGHAEVCAQYVDNGLLLAWAGLGESFERVQAA